MTIELEMVAALNTALERNDLGLILVALRDIARARGMVQIAQEAGMTPISLYKDLSVTGNPKFSNVLKIINVLGLRFHVASKQD